MSNNVTERFVVHVAWDINWSKVHEGIDFVFAKSGGFAGESFNKGAGVDFASAGWVENLEG